MAGVLVKCRRYWVRGCGIGLCSVLMLGCKQKVVPVAAAPVPVTKPAPSTPIDEKREEIGGARWNPDWNTMIEQSLPAEMLSSAVPRDVRRFCPQFYTMKEEDKRTFWAYFFQALAGAEAGLEPTTRVRHTQAAVAVTDKVSGRAVRSEGLLQLTYEDQQRYGCDFDWDHDKVLKADDPGKTILQPKNNLGCGVKILSRQIIDQHKALFSPSGYWSTLRPGTASYRVFAKQMANVPASCKVEVHRRSAAKRKVAS